MIFLRIQKLLCVPEGTKLDGTRKNGKEKLFDGQKLKMKKQKKDLKTLAILRTKWCAV